MFLIAGNRTQVLDLVQLIDVTVNELIVLIRRVFVDRHHILTSQTVQFLLYPLQTYLCQSGKWKDFEILFCF